MFRAVSLAALFLLFTGTPASTQDAAAGEKVFAVCRVCHQIGPTARNGVGPVLNGIVGRKAGIYAGFNYSVANKSSNLTWDEATLEAYLPNPQQYLKGTKMTFAGLKEPSKVPDLIAFLKQFRADGTKQP